MSNSKLAEKAYKYVQTRIFSGEFASGAVLSELKIAEELGMSRTPVGEAFRQLAGQGLVEQIPRYGTVVSSLTRIDIVELYEVREALEPFAASQATKLITEETLKKLEAFCAGMRTVFEGMEQTSAHILDADNLRKFLAYDMAFHSLIIQSSGNKRIQKIVNDTRATSRVIYSLRVEYTADIVQKVERFHFKILDALKSRDADMTFKLMAEHISISKRQALERFDRHEQESKNPPPPDLLLPEDLLRELKL